MTTTRARLQELGLDALREMAGTIDVEHDGLQKTKLITAIIGADKFDEKMLPELPPEPEVVAVATTIEEAGKSEKSGDQAESSRQNGSGRDRQAGGRDRQDGQDGGGRNRRRRNKRRPQEPIDESELEVRTGILDILPEGYGFLRCGGYLPSDQDVYVPANQIRKNKLRKGDICEGPIRPARAQEKFPALVRPTKVNDLEPEAAQERTKFASLTPLFPDVRLPLEV